MIADFLSYLDDRMKTTREFSVAPIRSGRDIPAGQDPHVHTEWELKFLSDRTLELVPPGVIHPASYDSSLAAVSCNGNSLTLQWGRALLLLNVPVGEQAQPLPTLFELYRKAPESAEELRAHLCGAALAALKLQVRALAETPVPTTGEALFRTAVDFLLHNYFRSELSIAELAEFTGFSPQYLNRQFRKVTGHGARQELIAIRLKRAHELLNTGEYLVADAARLTGWRCPFYFCNSFRKHFGVSPVTVRNRRFL